MFLTTRDPGIMDGNRARNELFIKHSHQTRLHRTSSMIIKYHFILANDDSERIALGFF